MIFTVFSIFYMGYTLNEEAQNVMGDYLDQLLKLGLILLLIWTYICLAEIFSFLGYE